MITHIMADGTILPDITGKVVKITEVKDLYDLLDKKRSTHNEQTKDSMWRGSFEHT